MQRIIGPVHLLRLHSHYILEIRSKRRVAFILESKENNAKALIPTNSTDNNIMLIGFQKDDINVK